MFGRQNFRECITDNLKSKGYGPKRTKEILDVFERKVKAYDKAGMSHPDADTKAMAETFQEVAYLTKEKFKRNAHAIEVAAEAYYRAQQGLEVTTSVLAGDRGAGLTGSKGVGVARGFASVIQADPRFRGTDFESMRGGYRNKFYALLGDALEHFQKGAFGVQRGIQSMDALVDELFGSASGDSAAASFAKAYEKLQGYMVDEFNAAGGSLRKLVDFTMPQKQSAVKLIKAGEDAWVNDHVNYLDWDRMTWPNGDAIEPEQRVPMLREAYRTLKSHGANQIKTNSLQGHGGSVGNQLEKDRFFIFKDAASWRDMHSKYGDGNVFEVVMEHIEKMANNAALVKTFGPTPSTWIDTVKAIGKREVERMHTELSRAGKLTTKERSMLEDFNSAMRRVEDMFTAALRHNSMDQNSKLGAVSTATSNVLASAQLGGAVIMAMPGDMFTTAAVRVLNGSNFAAGLTTYLKGMSPGGYGNLERMMHRAGFVFDETVASTYAAERFHGTNTYAAPVTRRISDVTLRATGLSRHTNAARSTAKLEQMGMLVEYSRVPYDELPFKSVLQRYGITADEWDQIRKVTPTSPDGGNATFIRPLDMLATDYKNKDTLYNKLYAFVDTEARYMVPASTLEAQVVAKGVTRPDTLAGLILHSFSMYKNYPLTFAMQYGRLALAQPDKLTRTAFLGAMGVGMTLVGATGLQIREVLKGRTPLPMDDPRFWGKAFAAGGAAGIFGDFLFQGTTEYGRGPALQVGGPIAGFYADAVNLTFGSGFKFAEQLDAGKDFDANLKARAVEFAKRYTPGTSVWYARLVLEREMWDRLQEMADPKARTKMRRKVRKQRETYGNTYWWQPGDQLGD